MALIKTYKSTPAVYTHQSRDFQTIGHIFEAVFNSSKLATDMLDRMMPNPNFDERLLGLSTTTVGFIRKHEYNTLDLTMILNSFAYLLRIKGTRAAIESALHILLRSQGISDKYNIDIDSKNKTVTLYLSKRLEDIVLLTDLFDYILPFGFTYRIIQSVISSTDGFPTVIEYVDDVEHQVVTNEGIVNETFKTVIDKVPTTTVQPRPVHNGEIEEISPSTTVVALDISNLNCNQVLNGSAVAWTNTNQYWATGEAITGGRVYSVELEARIVTAEQATLVTYYSGNITASSNINGTASNGLHFTINQDSIIINGTQVYNQLVHRITKLKISYTTGG